MPSSASWAGAYHRLAATIPAKVAAARLTMGGFIACVDARTDLAQATALFAPDAPPRAAALGAALVDRVRRGVGGEMLFPWPDGAAWLAAHLDLACSLGGTGAQAAWVLSSIGAPAAMSLGDRSTHMLAQLPPDILVVDGDRLVRCRDLAARGERVGDIYIFDFSAGVPVAGVLPPRSSRIIVRLADPGLDVDPDFDRVTPGLAATAGAGLISGFHAIPAEDLAAGIERVGGLCRRWSGAGLHLIHMEMAGYETMERMETVLDAFSGVVTSIGMSHSELRQIAPGVDTPAAMRTIAERTRVSRLCVHADEWAASVTRGDPDREREALMSGSLLAAARAEAGAPVATVAVPAAAHFAPPPFDGGPLGDGWHLVAVSTPYLSHPVTTLGLGDSFTGGCLLVLGAAQQDQAAARKDPTCT
ncbi:MAG: ADP-dependent glucokinase/phosphofructokinase [Amaricoccus sp.]|uniref:ADP-dependent glucokinase/phosphofructokinase n=1 Tax=Amaricoccus sp. TaxID=1872485 RepID=UPI0039E2FC29